MRLIKSIMAFFTGGRREEYVPEINRSPLEISPGVFETIHWGPPPSEEGTIERLLRGTEEQWRRETGQK